MKNHKTIIICGGASGLGQACVEHYLKEGFNVANWDITYTEAAQINTNLLVSPCDLTSLSSIQTALNLTVDTFGSITHLIITAGIVSAERLLTKELKPNNLDHIAKIFNTNVLGSINIISQVAANMATEQSTNNCIIMTSSIAAYEGQVGQIAYSASKGAIASLTLPLARDLAPAGIRVMTIAPGLMDTPMLHSLPDKIKTALPNCTTFPKRLGEPHEFAMLTQHIINNTYLNGSVIRLDAAARLP